MLVENLKYYFDENEKYVFCEDKDFQLNITLNTNKRILLLQDKLIYNRLHSEGGSQHAKRMENLLNITKKYEKYISEKLKKKLDVRIFFALGLMALRTNDKNAKKYNINAFKMSNIVLKFYAVTLFIISLLPNYFKKGFFKLYYNFNLSIGPNQHIKKIINKNMV